MSWGGNALVALGRYDKALEQCRKALELDPNFGVAFMCIGDAQLAQGRAEEALTTYRQAPKHGVRGRVAIAIAEARLRQVSEARRLVDQLVRESQRRYIRAERIGFVYAHLGDLDGAFRWFDKAYQARSAGMIYLRTGWQWAPVRSDPRFAALAKRVGIP